jgi:ubiquinone/menaquinone biosynthesis C-methylase UbiE
MAAVYDRVMASEERRVLGEYRRSLLAGVGGRVLEVGAGTGGNVPHYPDSVERLVLAEPDRHMRVQLERKHAGHEVSSAALGELSFEAESFDAVVCTLVLCTVTDPRAALADIRRVLRPGGRLFFMEHVADAGRALHLGQRVCEPLWKRLAGGCHLTRDTESEITRAGFGLEWIERDPKGMRLPLVRSVIRGVAVPG